MNHWVAIWRAVWSAVAVVLVVGLVCIFVPKCASIRELQRRKEALQAENARTEAMTRELMAKQERFRNDPAFVERVARETGMVKEGETVVKFTGEPLNSTNRSGL